MALGAATARTIGMSPARAGGAARQAVPRPGRQCPAPVVGRYSSLCSSLDATGSKATLLGYGLPAVKSTYTLDLETREQLERMARLWKFPKSEALRRAIRLAASQGVAQGGQDALDALDALQQSLDLSADAAEVWETTSRRERRDASGRRERHAT